MASTAGPSFALLLFRAKDQADFAYFDATLAALPALRLRHGNGLCHGYTDSSVSRSGRHKSGMSMNLKLGLADRDLRLTVEVAVIPSPVVTRAVAAAGADAVVIDQEHGAVGQEALHAMITAAAGTECARPRSVRPMSNEHRTWAPRRLRRGRVVTRLRRDSIPASIADA